MTGFEGDEPWNNFLEFARVGRRFYPYTDVTLTYDSTSGGSSVLQFSLFRRFQIYLDLSWILLGFDANKGRIVEITPKPKIQKRGHAFFFKRRQGGGRYG